MNMAQTASTDSLTASNALPVGTRIGEFEIKGLIGEGGFGAVYLAFDHSLMRTVAIKEYLPALLAARTGGTSVVLRAEKHRETFETGMRSFINEARMLAQFDHPALVKVFRFWEENNTAYMAMPYYEGETLRSLAAAKSEMLNEAWLHMALLPPLLDALATLHAHNVYHRDVSPDNILIQKNSAPVLLDFGAARRIISDRVESVTVILKPGYAPIEQYSSDTAVQCGPWSDVYALCAVLYFLIAHKTPPAAVARVINDSYEPLQARIDLADYTPEFLSAVDAGLALRPENRPQSIAELRERLLGRSEPPPSAVPSPAIDPVRASVGAVPLGERTQEIEPAVRTVPLTAVPEIAAAGSPLPEDPPAAHGNADYTVAAAGSHDVPQTVILNGRDAAESPIGKQAKSALVIGGIVLIAAGLAFFVHSRSGSKSEMAASELPASTSGVAKTPEIPAPAPAPATDNGQQSAEAQAAAAAAQSAAEGEAAWAAIHESRNIEDFKNYLANYPSGPHKAPAKQKLAALIASRNKAAAPGALLVNVTPWGNITVDGQDKGPSPPLKKLTLTAGKHRVVIENPGLPSVTTEIEIKGGQTVTLSHNFQ
jgi:non-specific serine/threonine protein kinase